MNLLAAAILLILRVQKSDGLGDSKTHQVMQPVRTFGVDARLYLGLASSEASILAVIVF